MSNIIAFRDKDHDRLVEIWHQAVVHTHTFLTEQDILFYYEMVKNGALEQVELWEAVNDKDEPTGFIGLDGTKIEMLFVDPVYHGTGVGSRLLQHAIATKGTHLHVDVNEQNEGARAFYKKRGFVQVGRSERDSSGQPFPLLHLEMRQ